MRPLIMAMFCNSCDLALKGAGRSVGTRLTGAIIGAEIGYSRIIKSTAETNGKDFFVSTSLQW